jgi:Protein of unknown function (DUF1573)
MKGLGYSLAASVVLGTFAYFVSIRAAQSPTAQLEVAVLNFGQVPPGVKVEKDFRIRNIGLGILKIEAIRTGCGCAEAFLTNGTAFSPGEEAVISVKMKVDQDLANAGAVTDLFVLTNDASNRRINVKLLIEPSDVNDGFDAVIDIGSVQCTDLPLERVFKPKKSIVDEVNPDGMSPNSGHLYFEKYEGSLKVMLPEDKATGEIHQPFTYRLRGDEGFRGSTLIGVIEGTYLASPGTVVIGPIFESDPRFIEKIHLSLRVGDGECTIRSISISDSLVGLLSAAVESNAPNQVTLVGHLQGDDFISPRIVTGHVEFEVGTQMFERVALPIILSIGKTGA